MSRWLLVRILTAFTLISQGKIDALSSCPKGPPLVAKTVRHGAHGHNVLLPTSSSKSSDRRDWILKSITGVFLSTSALVESPRSSRAQGAPSPTPIPPLPSERQALIRSIEQQASEAEVLQCIDRLLASSVKNKETTASSKSLIDKIDGEWKLIWSVGAQQFSPLLQLSPPFRPDSYQLAGSVATPVVGSGRIAQLLTSGVLGPSRVLLSSGVVDYEERLATTTTTTTSSSSSLLQIRPPFRLQVELPVTHQRITLVEAGSDADFRAVNVRSVEAQQAPPNLYQQIYVEEAGSGSLRISKIVEGDPVIVGATFVHIKI